MIPENGRATVGPDARDAVHEGYRRLPAAMNAFLNELAEHGVDSEALLTAAAREAGPNQAHALASGIVGEPGGPAQPDRAALIDGIAHDIASKFEYLHSMTRHPDGRFAIESVEAYAERSGATLARSALSHARPADRADSDPAMTTDQAIPPLTGVSPQAAVAAKASGAHQGAARQASVSRERE